MRQSDERRLRIRALREAPDPDDRKTVAQIAEELEITEQQVRVLMGKDRIERVIELRRKGSSDPEIAATLGISEAQVRALFQNNIRNWLDRRREGLTSGADRIFRGPDVRG